MNERLGRQHHALEAYNVRVGTSWPRRWIGQLIVVYNLAVVGMAHWLRPEWQNITYLAVA
jgi:hypothetical protein